MPAIVKLRLAEFDALTIERGWKEDKDRAAGLGISQSLMSRIRSGEVNPGAKFIDACVAAFGPLAYDRLFERFQDAA
jgi:hypothetical protein